MNHDRKHPRLAVLGAGTMGETILKGLLASGWPRGQLIATTRTREKAQALSRALGVRVIVDNAQAAAGARAVILALKPMQTLAAARELARARAPRAGTPVVSIAAGVSAAALHEALGGGRPVVRAMPNTPCAVGAGMTVLAAGPGARPPHLALARRLFAPLGRVLELEEKHFDTVTGLSASGPAFVFVMLEALADGGVARGLPRRESLELAAQMVFGAASMALQTGRHPAALKDDVTTPAGCTIAGILALEDGRIRSTLSRAVEIASRRAGELGGAKPAA